MAGARPVNGTSKAARASLGRAGWLKRGPGGTAGAACGVGTMEGAGCGVGACGKIGPDGRGGGGIDKAPENGPGWVAIGAGRLATVGP